MSCAKDMYLRAISGLEKLRGPNHSATLAAVFNLGLLYEKEGQIEDAKTLFARSLEGWQQLLGQEHSDTIDAAERLSHACIALGEFKVAEGTLMTTLAAAKRTTDLEPGVMAALFNTFGQLHFQQDKFLLAEEVFLSMLSSIDRTDYSEQASIIRNLVAITHQSIGESEKAASYYYQAAVGYQALYGPEDEQTMETFKIASSLGTCDEIEFFGGSGCGGGLSTFRAADRYKTSCSTRNEYGYSGGIWNSRSSSRYRPKPTVVHYDRYETRRYKSMEEYCYRR